MIPITHEPIHRSTGGRRHLLRVVSRWAAGAAERRHCQDQPGAPISGGQLRMVKIQPGGCKKTQATNKNRWLSGRIDLELLKSHDMTTSQKRLFREFMVIGKWKAIVVCLSDLCHFSCAVIATRFHNFLWKVKSHTLTIQL